MEKTIRVLVVDDHSLVREGTRQLFAGQPEIELVGEASDGQEALLAVKRLKPDVVILDIAMPTLSGLEAIPLIKEAVPRTQVVILTMFTKEAFVYRALGAGAIGYVLKTSPGAELVEAVHMASRGNFYLSSVINSEVIKSYLNKDDKRSPGASKYDLLTEREQQIFRLVVEGNSTRSIGDILCVSPKTVEKHRSNIIKKLDIHDPMAMVKYAIKIGVADPDLWE